MEIKIPEKNLKGFNNQAKDKLRYHIEKFIENLVEESYNLESSQNSTGDDPQITSNIVNEAKIFISRNRFSRKNSFWYVPLKILALLLASFVGTLLDIEKFKNPSHVFIFIIVIILTISMNAFFIIREDKQ